MTKLSEYPPHVQAKIKEQLQRQSANGQSAPVIKAPKMNRTELAYQEYLHMMYRVGALRWVSDHEPLSIKIAPRTHYRPDFMVQRQSGTLELHEVKGTKGTGFYIRDDANLKLKVVAKLLPFRVVIVWRVNGEWRERRVGE